MNNLSAFLTLVAHSELGDALIAKSDRGYNVIVGSTASAPDLFSSYADHPRKLVFLPAIKTSSTAAGRYQILARFFDVYKKQLGLGDFGPVSQDAIATQLIRECHALDLISAGKIEQAVTACSSRWASLPGSTYGQHVNKMDPLIAAYSASGGILA